MRDHQNAPRPPRGTSCLTGLLSVAAALGTGHLLAGLTGEPGSSPFLAVGNTAIDLAPEPVKDFAITTFGEANKTALLVGMAVVLAVLGAASGLAARRDPLPGLVLVGLGGAAGALATLGRPDLPAWAVAVPLSSAVVGGVVFALLRSASRPHGSREGTGTDPAATGAGLGRRRLLVSTGAVGLGSAAAALGGQALTGRGGLEESRRAVTARLPAAAPPPGGADFADQGTPTFITANDDFYRVDTALRVPHLRAEDWRLRVHGLVERELVLSFDDLLRRPWRTEVITMTCVSNEVGGPYVSTAEFVGVPVADLLREAGVRPVAERVFSASADGYTAATPVETLLDPDRVALLAFGMNGEALPPEHGFPVRMVTAGLYGYVSATKWVVDLELATRERRTYWEERGWAERAPIKTQSRIDSPRGFDTIPAGRTTVVGVAWAQTTGTDRVEVRVDDGPWQPATLAREVNPDTWRMWRAEVDLAPGSHRIACRATDRNGHTQPEERVGTVPDGATGWHSVVCTAE
ncbi:molybdopterin-dependent oxidoreductase [Actinoalloteichus spitiensis]|uniref:molybdopterin-dependent oxidoreductase n=1 Tax=Actinoalloteichus spitiensis TaxID=252394 RepID=UPI000363C347|nr:molybdopterin-dependent oxidoreductase [Actinoalloteichus spitiensis]